MSEVSGRHDEIQGKIVHEYDGIEEADNQLPLWWVIGFLFTIAFGIAYWLGYEVYQARPSPGREYAAAAAVIAEKQAAEIAAAPDVSAELLVSMAANPAVLASGAAVFKAQCVPCHGEKAEGKIGPNLTDESWIHGGSPIAIHRTIAEGVAAKGMPPWGPVIGEKSVREVSAFLLSVRNSNTANGKAAEGKADPKGESDG
jgi:cytochrome c oxidase cbb3-type subunit 3